MQNPVLASQARNIVDALRGHGLTDDTTFHRANLPAVSQASRFVAALERTKFTLGLAVTGGVSSRVIVPEVLRQVGEMPVDQSAFMVGGTILSTLIGGVIGHVADRGSGLVRRQQYEKRLRSTFGRIAYLQNHPATFYMARVVNQKCVGHFKLGSQDVENANGVGVSMDEVFLGSTFYSYSPAKLVLGLLREEPGVVDDPYAFDKFKTVLDEFSLKSSRRYARERNVDDRVRDPSQSMYDEGIQLDAELFALLAGFRAKYAAAKTDLQQRQLEALERLSGIVPDNPKRFQQPRFGSGELVSDFD